MPSDTDANTFQGARCAGSGAGSSASELNTLRCEQFSRCQGEWLLRSWGWPGGCTWPGGGITRCPTRRPGSSVLAKTGAGAVENLASRCRAIHRKRWIRVLEGPALSTRIHTFHRTISSSVLDRLGFEDNDTRRVGVCPTQVVALRAVPGPSRGALRDLPPNLHARATRDRDRQRLLPLPRVRSRSEGVTGHPRTDVPESHAAKTTGTDGVSPHLDGPSGGIGAFRGPAQNPARAGGPRDGRVSRMIPDPSVPQ